MCCLKTGARKSLYWIAFVHLIVAGVARANFGPEWYGDYAAELKGIKEVGILRENLSIDLRPLANSQPASVEATYLLYNSGSPKKLDLVFVFGVTGVSAFEVSLGDSLLSSRLVSAAEQRKMLSDFPETWQLPDKAPGIESDVTPYVVAGPVVLMEFSVELPAGPSTLTARYRARVGRADEIPHVTGTWQLPYILAPARSWGSFGDLEVTVLLPDGWESASAPPLIREGNILRGTFTGLPADSLVVSARAPVPDRFYQVISVCTVGYFLTLLTGLLLCRVVGHWYGHSLARRRVHDTSQATWRRHGIIGIPGLMGVLCALLITLAFFLGKWAITASLAGQESPLFHERFLSPLCGSVVIGLLAIWAGSVVTSRCAQRPISRAEET